MSNTESTIETKKTSQCCRWLRPTLGISFAVLFSTFVLILMWRTITKVDDVAVASSSEHSSGANAPCTNMKNDGIAGTLDSNCNTNNEDSSKKTTMAPTTKTSKGSGQLAIAAAFAAQVSALAFLLAFAGKLIQNE